jgi:hypothetical protein
MSNDNTPMPAGMDPRSQLSGPAVGLLVTGIIGGIFELTSFIAMLFGASWIAVMEEDIPEKLEGMFEASFWTASSLVGVMIAVFLIYASTKMREASSWGLCMAASILAMIPCISPCCLIGLPIGIWCLVVLTKPEIKAAFQ